VDSKRRGKRRMGNGREGKRGRREKERARGRKLKKPRKSLFYKFSTLGAPVTSLKLPIS